MVVEKGREPCCDSCGAGLYCLTNPKGMWLDLKKCEFCKHVYAAVIKTGKDREKVEYSICLPPECPGISETNSMFGLDEFCCGRCVTAMERRTPIFFPVNGWPPPEDKK